MKQIKIIDNSGKNYDAFVPESTEEMQKQISDNKKQNLKEHLYMGYLIIGTLAFSLGILISFKRLNGGQ
jgi:hypothetical protein